MEEKKPRSKRPVKSEALVDIAEKNLHHQHEDPLVKRLREQVEYLEIRLKHIENDYFITCKENEITTHKYLEILSNLEDIVRQRTHELEDSRRVLEQKTRELQIMIDASPSIIFYEDLNQRFIRVNKAFSNFLGLPVHQIIGRRSEEMFPLAEEMGAKSRTVINTGQALLQEVEVFQTERGERHMIVDRIPYKNIDGEIIGLVGFALDITDRAQHEREKTELEHQLRHTQKLEAIGTLAGGIAHDFNNILSIIIGYAELVARNTDSATPSHNHINEILTAGSRARDLIKQILTFSRQTEQIRRPVQLSFLLNEISKMLRASLPSTIRIQTHIASREMINADPAQIHQVVMNLATNAYHAMRELGGVLTIALTDCDYNEMSEEAKSQLEPGFYLKIQVSDNGSGIPTSIMHRIFEPYFTTKPQGQGTGLGLSIAHGIIKAHKGIIIVSSEVGKGTVFSVYLPRLEKLVQPKPSDEQTEYEVTPANILVVDDEPALAGMLKQTLDSYGYEATALTSSTDALEVFLREPGRFDIVVTDMTMPQMTGIRLSMSILHVRPDIPIILCTGFSDDINPENIKRFGINELVMKPILSQELVQKIEALLAQSRKAPKAPVRND